ncbi:MAG: DUF971 family protein [Pseudohongiellaceae bacterium]|jgi:DUF971 family protein
METPTGIKLHKKSGILDIEYADRRFEFSAEFLRVHSPSAEVKGHGPGQETLQYGKKGVSIVKLDMVGSYAIKPTFSDGHNSGIFSWKYLAELGSNQEDLWNAYLAKLKTAGKFRQVLPEHTQVITLVNPYKA